MNKPVGHSCPLPFRFGFLQPTQLIAAFLFAACTLVRPTPVILLPFLAAPDRMAGMEEVAPQPQPSLRRIYGPGEALSSRLLRAAILDPAPTPPPAADAGDRGLHTGSGF